MIRIKVIRITIGIAVVLVITITLFFLKAGNFLVVNEAPRKSDVIVVLTGDQGERVKFGVDLFKEGYSDRLLFSGGAIIANSKTEAETMAEQAMNLGIPVVKIILEDKSTNTYENALYTKQLVEKYQFQSALIVTSNYHMRRSKLVFNQVFQGTGIQLTYCAAQDENFKPNEWFKDKPSRNIVFSEYTKLIGYGILGRL